MLYRIDDLSVNALEKLHREFNAHFVLHCCGGHFGALLFKRLHSCSMPPVMATDSNPDARVRSCFAPVTPLADAIRVNGTSALFLMAVDEYASLPEDALAAEPRIREMRNLGCEHIGVLTQNALDFLTGCRTTSPVIMRNGGFFNADVSVPHYTTQDGIRAKRTAPPGEGVGTLHVAGTSVAQSYGVADGESFGPRLFEAHHAATGRHINVSNYGVQAGGIRPELAWAQIRQYPLQKGDVVLAMPLITPSKEYLLTRLHPHLCRIDEYVRDRGCRFVVAVIPPFFYWPETVSRWQNYIGQIFADGEWKTSSAAWDNPTFYHDEGHRRAVDRFVEALSFANVAVYDSRPLLEEILYERKREAYCDHVHLSEYAIREVAGDFCRRFFSGRGERPARLDEVVYDAEVIRDCASLVKQMHGSHAGLSGWLAKLPRRDCGDGARTGAIVMNANPFTLGHRHLVEQAFADGLDMLYLFVVEEDKSVFPFTDRIRLVREGLRDFGGRVAVVPSGNFVLSAFTFGEYFGKEGAEKERKVDPSFDIFIFGSIIAPALGITRRFVGEEPLCVVTNQYNDALRRYLPPLGISVSVLPRLTGESGMPISASFVRQKISGKDRDAVRAALPETTYTYLVESGRL